MQSITLKPLSTQTPRAHVTIVTLESISIECDWSTSLGGLKVLSINAQPPSEEQAEKVYEDLNQLLAGVSPGY